jgi:hypothetical protein
VISKPTARQGCNLTLHRDPGSRDKGFRTIKKQETADELEFRRCTGYAVISPPAEAGTTYSLAFQSQDTKTCARVWTFRQSVISILKSSRRTSVCKSMPMDIQAMDGVPSKRSPPQRPNTEASAVSHLWDVLDDTRTNIQKCLVSLKPSSVKSAVNDGLLFQAYAAHSSGLLKALDLIGRCSAGGLMSLAEIERLTTAATSCCAEKTTEKLRYSFSWPLLDIAPRESEARMFDCSCLMDYESPSLMRDVSNYFEYLLLTSPTWLPPRSINTFRINPIANVVLEIVSAGHKWSLIRPDF